MIHVVADENIFIERNMYAEHVSAYMHLCINTFIF